MKKGKKIQGLNLSDPIGKCVIAYDFSRADGEESMEQSKLQVI